MNYFIIICSILSVCFYYIPIIYKKIYYHYKEKELFVNSVKNITDKLIEQKIPFEILKDPNVKKFCIIKTSLYSFVMRSMFILDNPNFIHYR
jgi:hypothetical protein